MMIMGPDPAQDNLTVRKLLSDTEAPVSQLAEESFGSSLSKSLAWCVAVVDDERRVDLGSRQFANNPKTIPQLPEGSGIRSLLPTSSKEIDQSFALAH